MAVGEPGKVLGSLFQRSFPAHSDDRGGDEEFEQSSHGEVGGKLLSYSLAVIGKAIKLFAPTNNH
jgi:hypothetical protein